MSTSSKPILYYYPGSPPSRTVMMVAKELGIELQLKHVDITSGDHLEPWFVALNPQHTVPTLVDVGADPLWDGHAIATYLIGKYGGSADHPLYPRDLYKRALIDQRLQFDTAAVYVHASNTTRAILNQGATGPTEATAEAVHETYDLLEKFLHTDEYMVGDTLTVADLALVASVTQVGIYVPLQAAKWPKVAAWIGRLEQRPYFNFENTACVEQFVELIKTMIMLNIAL